MCICRCVHIWTSQQQKGAEESGEFSITPVVCRKVIETLGGKLRINYIYHFSMFLSGSDLLHSALLPCSGIQIYNI